MNFKEPFDWYDAHVELISRLVIQVRPSGVYGTIARCAFTNGLLASAAIIGAIGSRARARAVVAVSIDCLESSGYTATGAIGVRTRMRATAELKVLA